MRQHSFGARFLHPLFCRTLFVEFIDMDKTMKKRWTGITTNGSCENLVQIKIECIVRRNDVSNRN